ncbi:hypothetical protein D3C81_1523100 [compost metagenome]
MAASSKKSRAEQFQADMQKSKRRGIAIAAFVIAVTGAAAFWIEWLVKGSGH